MVKFIKITHKGRTQYINVDYIAIVKPQTSTDLIDNSEFKTIILVNDGALASFKEFDSNQSIDEIMLAISK